MTQGELFAGIGGFGLAGRWAGIESVFQVEWNPFCQKVLKKNFPNAQLFGDIREFDGRQFAGTIDIISGGFPCQPFSVAGQRRGKDDDRALWGEMLRVIREVRPAWVVGENVSGIISMELDTVLADLEGIGYTCQAFVVPACAVNALHRRDRVWIVAHAKSPIGEQSRVSRQRWAGYTDDGCGYGWTFTDPDCERQQQSERLDPEIGRRSEHGNKETAPNSASRRRQNGRHGAQPESCEANEFGNVLGQRFQSVEWQPNDSSDILRAAYGLPGRVDRRGDRIKSLGNAIVPQVAYQIFDTIKQYEKLR